MRTRLVNRDLNPLLTTLPAKFSTIHDYQIDAVGGIVEAFDDGVKVVVLDAPTGSGKTVIAEIVRRMLETRGVYVCHNKELQAQFAGDFKYSSVLYGRANYTPISSSLVSVTCEDCTWTRASQSCAFCEDRSRCPYQIARNQAIHSPIPVLNSAYWLTETNHGKRSTFADTRSTFADTGLAILDECDTVESVLMGQVEIYISAHRAEQYSISPPDKLTKDYAHVDWARRTADTLLPVLQRREDAKPGDIKGLRELRWLRNLVQNVSTMVENSDERWVYTGGAGSSRRTGENISFKPVQVARWGEERIWSRDKRFLLMSGTVVSPGMLLSGLGYDGDYRVVSMVSQFHAKNRQVVVRPVADMTRKGQTDDGKRAVSDAIAEILRFHADDRVLIHTVSYQLAELVSSGIQARPTFTYRNGTERARAISDFKRTGQAVLVAPSADRGVDLPGDLCRVQIILKVPYLSLGDKQTSERLYNTPDGKVWYNVQVARSIQQMVGRAVRSRNDWAVTYILDSDFVRWYRAWGHLFPAWFRKGIRFEQVPSHV
jgi:ATP-dependent DNA helicase DinG